MCSAHISWILQSCVRIELTLSLFDAQFISLIYPFSWTRIVTASTLSFSLKNALQKMPFQHLSLV